MALLTAVDLRSDYGRTYNQGSDNACGPFAVANALDCIYERATGKPTRFDPIYLWEWVRFHAGMAGTNTGSTFPTLEKALRLNGMRLDSADLTGFSLMRTMVQDQTYKEVKHLLCMGVPVIWEMKVTADVYELSGDDWKKHRISADTSTSYGQHYVCIVGYDDTCQRWLVENSWGSDWGDGGFFGVPYASLPRLTESLQHLNLTPVNPKPVEGYTVPAYMLTADKAAFTDRATEALRDTLMQAFGRGVPDLLETCKRWGVSDKHLETLYGWNRGQVRAFKVENPDLNWDGFIWDQL